MTPQDQSQRDLATDVTRSVIVQAPAGSGKTTLLVHRYLKLLARVQEPEEILAITFTIKAAGEMRARVLEAIRNGDPIAQPALQRSAELNWNLLEQPKRLKIQTIDSFSMSLARQLPLQSGFNPNTQLTELADELYAEAADAVLLRLYRDDPFENEIADFLRQCGNEQSRARRLLALMLAKRDQWLSVVSAVMRAYQQTPETVPETLNLGSSQLTEVIIETFCEALSATQLHSLMSLTEAAAGNLGLTNDSNASRFRSLGELLTTAQGKLRKQITKREGFPADQRERKAELLEIISTLKERQLEAQAANLRFIPQSPDTAASHNLVSVCICLTLAALELKTVFDRHQASDFTELLLSAQAALGDTEAPTDLALALDHRISHVLVDEFQDTSVSQFRLFEALLEGWSEADGNTFFAVGDPMQSIYRFRDADVGLFYRAATSGIASVLLESVSLQSNFRSTPRLVEWCNSTFASVLGNSHDPVLGAIAFSASRATRPSLPSSSATINLSGSESQQCKQIVRQISTVLAGDDDSTVAVLVRSRGQLLPLLTQLRAGNINWHASDIDSLTKKPVIIDLLAACRLIEDPDNRLAALSILRSPWCGLLLPDLELLAAGGSVLREDFESPPGLSPDARQRLQRLRQVWQRCHHLRDEAPPRTLLETFWLQMGGADGYADPGLLDHADRFLQLVDRHCPEVLDTDVLQRAAEKLFANDVSRSRLQIMTIHKAKGLEFDHVILPFLEKTTRADEPGMLLWRPLPDGLLLGCKDDGGVYDWLTREDKAREKHERERLLYVAATRAKTSLHLFATPGEKPPAKSLLSLLWPDFEKRIESGELSIEPDAGLGTAPPTSRALTAGSDEITRPRLLSGYQWQPPEAPVSLDNRVIAAPVTRDELSAQREVALGIIMHRELELLAQRALPDIEHWLELRQPVWLRQSASLGVADDARADLLDIVSDQLRRVLADEQGRWILCAREDAYAELALSFVPPAASGAAAQAEISHLILDRTFRAGGLRWLIDYKTAIPESTESNDVFIRTEINRYRGQLQRYADAASVAFSEPIRIGVYFTALPRLELIS
jgi:ATP-dependent exoDNAse (exonuclease V) beta subunit